MPEKVKNKVSTVTDRKLGDEWVDWDGTIDRTDPVRKGTFVGIAALAVAFLIGAVYFILWLIEPRLIEISPVLCSVLNWAAHIFMAVVALWLLFFALSAIAGTSILGRLLIIPYPVNWLLNIALRIRRIVGVSSDRLVNSFIRVHNVLLPGRHAFSPDELLVLLPRCLTKENFSYIRSLRDKFKFDMATAGGGEEARKKIKLSNPKAIIAIACERDLISGFIEVNPHIPVVGLPIMRPEGPCKNTEVNKEELELLIKRFLSIN